MISKTAKKMCERFNIGWSYDFAEYHFVLEYPSGNRQFIKSDALKQMSAEEFKQRYLSDVDVVSTLKRDMAAVDVESFQISYFKVFHEGVLKGQSVEARCPYPTRDGAQRHLEWANAGPHKDLITGHKFHCEEARITSTVRTYFKEVS